MLEAIAPQIIPFLQIVIPCTLTYLGVKVVANKKADNTTVNLLAARIEETETALIDCVKERLKLRERIEEIESFYNK